MSKTKQKGFTLIELLVVIAIIGLLAGIVLVSLGGARDRARDGRIQADISQVRALAELVYNDASAFSYAGLCDAGVTLNTAHANYGSELGTIEADVTTQGGTAPDCYGTATDYCVSAALATSGRVCVNSTGETGTGDCASAVTDCTP
jgi:prepilin-type N-terminal cleavage/methylation domain-containing protein